ncbi:MAG TPA: type VI secretion system baseplate subunit TssF [Pyrinomonadaceae bacterium]|nr:type VI secretion system baseplate subunit TssF [Chloracidobacterium sp.]MBP9935486.1 type VI secretion system baseplate subunit TssF [Pyrinomonadaceae bacterium]MBK7801899.1 type VI secretion system baseplate subunit TssF [Chloracidobacterium sp.]MBK9437958.1 type VI secretion system baseplate subunit TssF [Chloracidobacterium sp.]MBK9765612.1 type VI secretion system baseplate subunit TssF [Chloracidobacterium sp.]
MRDELLGYYERELVFLRRMGAEFAKKYPKIAARLQLDEDKVEDPHVERMIEAFAYLTARIGHKLDDELPEITEAFLNILYPHYLSPIPSMAIVQFSYGSPNDNLTAAQTIERGTRLNSRPVDGTPCRFRTAFDVDLMPIEIQSAALESPAPKDARGNLSEASIRLSMRCYGNANLSELKNGATSKPPEKMRFYLDGEPQLVFPLYEILLNHATAVEFRAKDAPIDGKTMKTITNIQFKKPDPVILAASDVIKAVGFDESEAVLPFTKRSFAGYRLLTEYFAFPYKFLFFDLYGIDQAIAKKFGSHFDIVIHLRDITPPVAPITNETFRLGCSPIVNLFSKLSDPIYLSQKKFEYQIIPDVHRQSTTEIYSVNDVITTDPRSNRTREFSPFYSMRHAYGEQLEKSFWYGVRRPSQRTDDAGTEVFLSLVDLKFNPLIPAVEVLNVKTTCTNRDLPAKLPFGGKEGDFEVEGTALLSRVRCLTKPTETIRPPQRRSAQWRLISHLNLNYLSLVNAENGTPEALQELLHLYNFADSSVTRKQILGITKIATRKVVRQIGGRIGAGFVRGLETTLTFDEEQYVGSGLFLFASVLERFLGLYSSINSFNQLVVRTEQREENVRRFAPRAGEQELS